jgi:hypothetical protein
MPKIEVTSVAPAIAADRGYLLSVTVLMSNAAARGEATRRQRRCGRRIPGVAGYLAEFTCDPWVAHGNNLLSGSADEAPPHDVSLTTGTRRR